MLIYKINVLEALKEKGYSTSRLRKEKILGEGSIQDLRNNKVGVKTLDTVCGLLNLQPGSIIKYVSDDTQLSV